jgi:hypothetical protein
MDCPAGRTAQGGKHQQRLAFAVPKLPHVILTEFNSTARRLSLFSTRSVAPAKKAGSALYSSRKPAATPARFEPKSIGARARLNLIQLARSWRSISVCGHIAC